MLKLKNREEKKEAKLEDLIFATPKMNEAIKEATPFVKQYWDIINSVWHKGRTVYWGYQQLSLLKQNQSLKKFNKEYREILK